MTFPYTLPSSAPADHGEVKNELIGMAAELGTAKAMGSGDWLGNAWHCYTNLVEISASNRSYACPFWVPETDNFDAVAVEVTTADGAGTARFHRYAPHANGYPGAKNIDQLVASVVVTSTGIKICSFAASTEFVRGWHYLVLENTAGAARYRKDTLVNPRFHPCADFTSVVIGPTKGGYFQLSALGDPWGGDTTPIRDTLALALRKT